MPTTKQTAFKLNSDDLALMDEVKERHGLLSRAAALRFVLRFWARCEGVELRPKAKRRGKKR